MFLCELTVFGGNSEGDAAFLEVRRYGGLPYGHGAHGVAQVGVVGEAAGVGQQTVRLRRQRRVHHVRGLGHRQPGQQYLSAPALSRQQQLLYVHTWSDVYTYLHHLSLLE